MSVPKLRFKEFIDEWKKVELDKLYEFKNGLNGDRSLYGKGVELINVSDILNNTCITSKVINGKININEDTLRKNSVEYGDILFQRSSETFLEIGTSNVYLDNKLVTFSGFVIRGKRKKDNINNPLFINYELKSPALRKKIIICGSGAQHFNIGQEDLKRITIFLPSIKEQKKIADMLELLDKKIELQTKRIEVLKLFKLALQNNIYASINNKIKLEDIGCFISGYGFPEKYQGHKNLSIPFYKVSDMNNFGNEIYMNNSNNTLSLEICSHLKLRPIPNRSIIFAKIGAAIMLDRKRIATPPFLIDNNMMSYYINREDIDFDYIFYFLDSIKFSHYVQQGALPSLSSGDLGKIKIPFVNIQKQKIIGTTFNLYTRKIILETEKLSKLFELKKALMYNMFI